MGKHGQRQSHQNALIFLLAGTAVVAVAATYYSRLQQRPRNGQQSTKLHQLLAEVTCLYTPQCRLTVFSPCISTSQAHIGNVVYCFQIPKTVCKITVVCFVQYRKALHIPAEVLSTIRDEMVSQVGCCSQQSFFTLGQIARTP